MKSMTSNELRQAFLKFFRENDHEIVASSPLLPGNDPTLLFTNAGMVQFKDVFLGDEKRSYSKATSSQRCLRAGGKHNDLENVGYTARHHTFFEMLGNFSFGDYFKREAIQYSWDFLTGTLGLAPEKLWVTVLDDDDEAADIWLNEIKVNPERFSRLDAKNNFWAMGDTGPCGPCSEIFYDHGTDVPGGPPGSLDEDGDRYVEIWNLVFMQFDRSENGEMVPLPKPSVDTGMGLERIAAVMQGVHSNYDIDLFTNLILAIADVLGIERDGSSSLNVIADHIRACSFLIVDGVLPGNEGRGYVLRRIIRRAIRHGKKLGTDGLFFHKLVAPLAKEMGDAYPELVKAVVHVEKVLQKEEHRFAETLDQGMEILESAISELKGGQIIPGTIAFKLYDTYGFPIDLTADIARERNLTIDHNGFEVAMGMQRDRARAASKFGNAARDSLKTDIETEFLGYDGTDGMSEIVALYKGDKLVDSLQIGEEGIIILSATPFYAESGGQIGDKGILVSDGKLFSVLDTQKSDKANIHFGIVDQGDFQVGDKVQAIVDAERRQAIRLNHTATHLMHAALQKVIGDHVAQKGSYVAPDRLRFDFSHYERVTSNQIQEIEDIVNAEIRNNTEAVTQLMAYDEAIDSGAMALFGEKYGDTVRVLKFSDFSVELCGGTHVDRTGDIGVFKITSESGIASGVRRIEALTGKGAMDWININQRQLGDLAGLLKTQPDLTAPRIKQLLKHSKVLEKELAAAKQALISGSGIDLTEGIQEIADIKVMARRMDGADTKTLRAAVDKFKDKLGSAVVVLGSVNGDRVHLAVGVTKDNIDKIKANDLIKPIAEKIGGKGGGRADFAQAGGADVAALDHALESVVVWVTEQLI
jgi:alanyl-tRNA synthetase